MSRKYQQSGFTIVELMLAMGFVSALLLAIAMTVIQIGNIYNHGVTLKAVNQSGSVISREIQRSISGSLPFGVTRNGGNYINEGFGGRLCTGQYSYIWNYGNTLSDHGSSLYDSRNKYSGDVNDNISFVKVYDSGSGYCKRGEGDVYPDVNQTQAVELLNIADQTELAIHSFSISVDPLAYNPSIGQALYSIEYWIGTNDQNALFTDTDGIGCRPPSDPKSDPFFCSVIRFNITARAGNVSNSNE